MVQFNTTSFDMCNALEAAHSKAMQCEAGGSVHVAIPPLQREKQS